MRTHKMLRLVLLVSVSLVFMISNSYALDLFGKKDDKAEKTDKKVNVEDLLARVNSIAKSFDSALNKIIDAQDEIRAISAELEATDIKEIKEALKDALKIENTLERWQKVNDAVLKISEIMAAKSYKEKLKVALSDVSHVERGKQAYKHLQEAIKYDQDALNEANLLLPDLKSVISSFSFTEALKQREAIGKLKDASTELLPFIAKNVPNQLLALKDLGSDCADALKVSANLVTGKNKKSSKTKK